MLTLMLRCDVSSSTEGRQMISNGQRGYNMSCVGPKAVSAASSETRGSHTKRSHSFIRCDRAEIDV